MKASRATTLRVLVGALLILPWLNPFAPGPSPAVVPWLVAAFCFMGIFFFCAAGKMWLPSVRLLDPPMVASTWLLAASLSAAIGICQYIGWASYFGQWVNEVQPGQAFGNLRQRNQFSDLLNLGLIGLLWFARPKEETAEHLRLLISACAVLLGIGIAISASRTGLLQLLLVTLLYWYWIPNFWSQRKGRLLYLAWVSYAVAGLVAPLLTGVEGGILSRGADIGPACASRMVLWGNVLDLIALKPWLGWGWGELDYAHYATLYAGPRFCDILDNAHNLPLHLAVELGIPAALLLCGLGTWWVVRQRPWREPDATRQLAWSILAVIFLHSLLEYPLWYGPFQIAFGLCVGFLLRDGGEPSLLNARDVSISTRLMAAAAVVACCAYAAWDYYRVSQIYLTPQARSAAYRENTMEKIRGSWLFRNQVRFAELTTTPLKRDNAQWTFDAAAGLLRFSPEPRVIEKVIESAVMLGRDDEALLHLARYRAAFPGDYEKWRHVNGLAGAPTD